MKLEIPAVLTVKAKKRLVAESEERFENDLDELTRQLVERKDLKIISLCGPSCAGKTTTSLKIISAFSKMGVTVKTVSIDDFYKNRDDYAEECAKKGVPIDLEAIDSIDVAYLKVCFTQMLSGKTAYLPTFDFVTATRISTEPFKLTDHMVILFEGIQTFYPEIKDLFKPYPAAHVFIDAGEGVETVYGHFTDRDLRIARRLVRDWGRRGSSPERTFLLWKQVIDNEDKNIYPYVVLADYRIHSAMAYEPMILKKHVEEVLGRVKEDSEFYGQAREILAKFAPFPVLEDEYLPAESVYHEFL